MFDFWVWKINKHLTTDPQSIVLEWSGMVDVA